MSAMTNENDRLLAALAAVDQIQRERQQTNQLMDREAQDLQTEAMLREMLSLQGEAVDEATIKQAIAVSREPKPLPFNPMPKGLGRTMAEVYIKRDRWLGKVIGGVSAVALSGIIFLTGNAVIKQEFETAARATFASVSAIGTQLGLADQNLSKLDGHPVLRGAAEAALADARHADANIRNLLGGELPADRDELSQVKKQAGLVDASLQKIDALVNDASTLDTLRNQAKGIKVDTQGWAELEAAEKMAQNRFEMAYSQSQVAEAQQAVSLLSSMSHSAAERNVLRAEAASMPEVGRGEADRLVSLGELALLGGNMLEAAQARQQIASLKSEIAMAYTLRIVDEPGEKSGLWRYPNDNPNGRNYYVVVDALDPSGNPTRITVRNEETGRQAQVSRFAVRVPETFYEQVKSDKLDNGLVDEPEVGKKVAGELTPTFAVPVAGGYITHW